MATNPATFVAPYPPQAPAAPGHLANQNIETYTRRGCVGCCKCEGGANNVLRAAALWAIGLMTCGVGLLVLAMSKSCVYCGHNKFMNAHGPHAMA